MPDHPAGRPAGRRSIVLGRLLLSTVAQLSSAAPRVDTARCGDTEGRVYGALVFGRGRHAPVVGWRDWTLPRALGRGLTSTWPWPASAVGRWLFGYTGPRRSGPVAVRAGRRLRALADRVDPDHAPRVLGFSFTFERGEGLRLRTDGRGCRLAYLGGEGNLQRAHEQADAPPPRIPWGEVAGPGELVGRIR